MLKQAAFLLSCLFMLACGLCAIYAAYWPAYRPDPHPSVEYKDFVAILLTAVTVMVALAAFIVAILTIFGYEAIKRIMIEASEKAAKDHVQQSMPRIVEQVMEFIQSGTVEGVEDTPAAKDRADQIAQAYAQEPDDGERVRGDQRAQGGNAGPHSDDNR